MHLVRILSFGGWKHIRGEAVEAFSKEWREAPFPASQSRTVFTTELNVLLCFLVTLRDHTFLTSKKLSHLRITNTTTNDNI